jgi:hypothetical protein
MLGISPVRAKIVLSDKPGGQVSTFKYPGLNIVAKCLTLLLHIWEVLGSSLGLETGYPD